MTLKISGIFPGHFLVMLFGLKNVQSPSTLNVALALLETILL